MTFWQTATQEQKLAQIDGGIECGMTTEQIAFNCGVEDTPSGYPARYVLANFANRHGRRFGGALKARRLREFNATKREKQTIENCGAPSDVAFSIFDNHSEAFELEWPA